MKKFIVLCLIVLLASCGKPDLSPREINQKTDKCKVCNMMIDHPEQAAQMVFNNEDHYIFDDVGCLIEQYKQEDKKEIGMMYVKDYKSNKWIDAQKAHYAYNEKIWTPMNYGVAAFKDKKERDRYASKYSESKKMQFNDLLSLKWGVHQ
ncbi:nitrous oxide reductase accessory protein NosL [Macrococcus animalis]|uniref:nitrous oxide reductase accessory protein NosL n=1 Tax=Macrococcus animalis TaxID=3395467 RepID=UPI0039BDA717